MSYPIYSNFNLDIPKIGYFWLHTNNDNNCFSNRIEAEQLKKGFTPEQAKTTHVEVCYGGQWSLRVVPFEKIRRIDIRDYYAGKKLKLVRYKGGEHYECISRYKVALWASDYSNRKYDLSGVFAFLSIAKTFIHQNVNKGFCSEVGCYGLRSHESKAFMGMKPEVHEDSDCMPAHFHPRNDGKDQFEIVWEGYIPFKTMPLNNLHLSQILATPA